MRKLVLNVAGKHRVDVALLLMRLMLGIVFIYHGWPKLVAAENFVGFFGSIGIPAPEIMVPLVGGIEVVGGLLLILGFLTNISAWLLAATMLVAAVMAHGAKGFSVTAGGYEYALTLAVMCVALAHLGAGKFALWKHCGNCDSTCADDCGCCGTCKTSEPATPTA
jgi:putative oxidoreductase